MSKIAVQGKMIDVLAVASIIISSYEFRLHLSKIIEYKDNFSEHLQITN